MQPPSRHSTPDPKPPEGMKSPEEDEYSDDFIEEEPEILSESVPEGSVRTASEPAERARETETDAGTERDANEDELEATLPIANGSSNEEVASVFESSHLKPPEASISPDMHRTSRQKYLEVRDSDDENPLPKPAEACDDSDRMEALQKESKTMGELVAVLENAVVKSSRTSEGEDGGDEPKMGNPAPDDAVAANDPESSHLLLQDTSNDMSGAETSKKKKKKKKSKNKSKGLEDATVSIDGLPEVSSGVDGDGPHVRIMDKVAELPPPTYSSKALETKSDRKVTVTESGLGDQPEPSKSLEGSRKAREEDLIALSEMPQQALPVQKGDPEIQDAGGSVLKLKGRATDVVAAVFSGLPPEVSVASAVVDSGKALITQNTPMSEAATASAPSNQSASEAHVSRKRHKAAREDITTVSEDPQQSPAEECLPLEERGSKRKKGEAELLAGDSSLRKPSELSGDLGAVTSPKKRVNVSVAAAAVCDSTLEDLHSPKPNVDGKVPLLNNEAPGKVGSIVSDSNRHRERGQDPSAEAVNVNEEHHRHHHSKRDSHRRRRHHEKHGSRHRTPSQGEEHNEVVWSQWTPEPAQRQEQSHSSSRDVPESNANAGVEVGGPRRREARQRPHHRTKEEGYSAPVASTGQPKLVAKVPRSPRTPPVWRCVPGPLTPPGAAELYAPPEPPPPPWPRHGYSSKIAPLSAGSTRRQEVSKPVQALPRHAGKPSSAAQEILPDLFQQLTAEVFEFFSRLEMRSRAQLRDAEARSRAELRRWLWREEQR
eukprot:RCo018766